MKWKGDMIRRTALSTALVLGGVGLSNAEDKALRFDCGPKDQQAAPGFTSLSGQDVYTLGRGCGWLKAWGMDSAGKRPKGTVCGSSTGAKEHVDTRPDENDVTFRADVPDGVYAVTVWVGSESPREGRLGICVAANGRTVLAPPGGGGWGVVTERTLPAVADEGVLLLNFYVVGKGGAARLEILGFKIEPAAGPEQQAALRAKWMACALKSEKPREVSVKGKTFTEAGRRHEIPFGVLPEKHKDQELVLFTRANPGDILDYSIPRQEELCDRLGAFAAPGEDQPAWFGVYALRELKRVRVACSDLAGAGGAIPAGQVELFTQTTRPRSLSDRASSLVTFTADLLDAYAPFDVPQGRSQPVYLRIRIPAAAVPGYYTGVVTVASEDIKSVDLPLTLRVLPLMLPTPKDKVWHIFADATRWVRMGRPEWSAELEDMARHGVNSLSVGYPPMDGRYIERDGRIVDAEYGMTGEILQHAAKIGMRGPVLIGSTPGILMRFRGWNISHVGAASHAFVPGQEGRALLLEHAAADARSGADQAIGVLLPPGASVRFEVRYKSEGGGTASAGLTFMKTHKRGAVDEGKISLALKPAAEWQTVSAVTRVPQDALYGRASLSFSGGPGHVLIDEVRLLCGEPPVNRLVNPGFERDIDRPAEDAAEWPEPFMREFVDSIKALGQAVKRAGLEPWIEGTDEAQGTPREKNEMRAARLSGLPTFCNLSPTAVEGMGTNLDAVCLYSAFLGKEPECASLLDAYHKRNQKLFFIASGAYVGQEFDWMPNRNHVGLCFWKSDADGTGIWTFQRPSADPFDDLDGDYKDYCLVFPPRKPGGSPVPTLGWEGIREGWRDFRYVCALERAVAQAEKDGRASAADMGRTVLAFIRDSVPWFDQAPSVGYDNASADRLRWLSAWATLEVQSGKGPASTDALPSGARALEVAFAPSSPSPPAAPLWCPPTETAPVLDGSLDDSMWAAAGRVPEFQSHTAPGAPAQQKTEVFLCHDAMNLYVGLRCFEPAMERLKAAVLTRDGEVFVDDSIELFLDTQNDEFRFFQLAFNAAGTRFDQLCAGDNNAGANVFGAAYSKQKVRDVGWNGEWRVKTRRYADRWEAEVALPFRTFGRASDLWGVNVCRNRRAGESETSAWRVGGFFHQPNRFGKMLLAGARNGGSALTAIDLPLSRFGGGTARITLPGGEGLKGHAEVEDKGGKVCRSEGSIKEGLMSLPYRLDEAASALTLTVEEGDVVLHRIRMAKEVAVPITLKRAPKVLSFAAPRGVFEVAIQTSEKERAARRFQVVLSGPDGKIVDRLDSALSGENCKVSLNLERFPQGMYTLAFSLPGPEGAALIERRESVVLVPPFLAGQP